MIRKKALIEISNYSLNYKDITGRSFIDKLMNLKKCEKCSIKADNIEDIKVDFANKNLFVVIDGEEVYVKLMILPKVKKEKLHEIIKSELEYRFKNMDNIMFTYQIIKDNGLNLEAAVFCLNWNKVDLIKKCMERGGKIKGIYPIQFCILNNYRKTIKDKKHIFIFIYEDILYFLACLDNKIVANSVMKVFTEKDFMEELEKFQAKCSVSEAFGDFSKMFFLNFPNKDLIEDMKRLYECIDLGDICKDDIQFV